MHQVVAGVSTILAVYAVLTLAAGVVWLGVWLVWAGYLDTLPRPPGRCPSAPHTNGPWVRVLPGGQAEWRCFTEDGVLPSPAPTL